jgi:hypothetical protein
MNKKIFQSDRHPYNFTADDEKKNSNNRPLWAQNKKEWKI